MDVLLFLWLAKECAFAIMKTSRNRKDTQMGVLSAIHNC